jgi:hypothetical protein
MTWLLWLLPYLVVGIVIARFVISRYPESHVSEVDAFALMVLWPLFLLALATWTAVHAIGRALGGGKR